MGIEPTTYCLRNSYSTNELHRQVADAIISIMEYYQLELCGLTRKLPIVYIGRNTRLASFSILGDLDLVNKVSRELVKKFKKMDFDFIVGPESKVVPLVHEVSRQMKKERYVICRKSIKPYMAHPVTLKPLPFFPKHVRQLVIDGPDAELIRNRKVVVLDDVVSTGVTMRMMVKLMEKIGAKVVLVAAVLSQGEQFPDTPAVFTLGKIPILTEK